MHKVYNRIIISGNVIEFMEYEKPYFKDYEINSEWIRTDKKKDIDKTDNRFDFSLKRSKNEIRRLINSNYATLDKFITLTFDKNATNLDYCNYEFKKFMQRLKYRYGKLQYVVVVEFQKRGAVHYHMISDLGYVRNKTLQQIWKNGFVKINRVQKIDNIGAYVVKYMQKDIQDDRLKGRKSYFRSKNLNEPIEYTQKKEVDALTGSLLQDLEPIYQTQYDSEYTGLTSYKQFNISELKKSNSVVL